MSTKASQNCLSICHNSPTLLRSFPASRAHLRAIRTFSIRSSLSGREPPKARTTIQKERGKLTSFRTRQLAKGIIDQKSPYPRSIWGNTSWTQIQMVKMGIPNSVRGQALEFMFYGQVHQESPAFRVDYWKKKFGKQKVCITKAVRASFVCTIGFDQYL